MNVLQGRADLFDEQASGISERDAARRPIEQADTKVCLELADGIAASRTARSRLIDCLFSSKTRLNTISQNWRKGPVVWRVRLL